MQSSKHSAFVLKVLSFGKKTSTNEALVESTEDETTENKKHKKPLQIKEQQVMMVEEAKKRKKGSTETCSPECSPPHRYCVEKETSGKKKKRSGKRVKISNKTEYSGEESSRRDLSGEFSGKREKRDKVGHKRDKSGEASQKRVESGILSRKKGQSGEESRKRDISGEDSHKEADSGIFSRKKDDSGIFSRKREQRGEISHKSEESGIFSRKRDKSGVDSHKQDQTREGSRKREKSGEIDQRRDQSGDSREQRGSIRRFSINKLLYSSSNRSSDTGKSSSSVDRSDSDRDKSESDTDKSRSDTDRSDSEKEDYEKQRIEKSDEIIKLGDKLEHKLPTVTYSIRNKFQGYEHSREFSRVNYQQDVEAYHYRGYEIKAPEIGPVEIEKKQASGVTAEWVHYMTHAELHKMRIPPKMFYNPKINGFVQLVLIIQFLSVLFTLFACATFKSLTSVRGLVKQFPTIWIPGCMGVVVTVYTVLCSACARVFPLNYIMLVINVLSMTYMCSYVTLYHDTYGVIIATGCILIILIVFILMALCDVDFSKFGVLVLALFLGVVVPVIMYMGVLSLEVAAPMQPTKPRHFNMMLLGIATYSTSMIFMLQLILKNRTIIMGEDDYPTGALIVYMCEICMFMKLVAHLGLFDENHR